MNIPETYDYLMRARRDLWAALETVPDELLSRPLAGDDWFSCLKDLVFHMATVEDGWIHGDILREEPVLTNYPALRDAEEGGVYIGDIAGLLAGRGKEHPDLPCYADRRGAEPGCDGGGLAPAAPAVQAGRFALARDDSRDAAHGADCGALALAGRQTAFARFAVLPVLCPERISM